MQRLADLTESMKNSAAKLTAGRFLQCLAMADHNAANAIDVVESRRFWADQPSLATAIRAAAVAPVGTGDFPPELGAVRDSFLAAMRPFSIPLQLSGLRKTPMLTRVFIGQTGMVAAEVTEGQPIPVMRGDWSVTQLTPRKFAGIVVQTLELMKSASPTASGAIVDDLASAVAEAENFAFLNPSATGSVFFGATNFVSTGSTVSAVDADLQRLVGNVAGSYMPGTTLIMAAQTAAFLGTLRGSGGAAAYSGLGPQGGFLLGMPVLISSAMEFTGSPSTRAVGLLVPSQIFFADASDVRLSTASAASLQMSDAPVAGPAAHVSVFQTSSAATRAIKLSAWFARPNGTAYFVCNY